MTSYRQKCACAIFAIFRQLARGLLRAPFEPPVLSHGFHGVVSTRERLLMSTQSANHPGTGNRRPASRAHTVSAAPAVRSRATTREVRSRRTACEHVQGTCRRHRRHSPRGNTSAKHSRIPPATASRLDAS